MNLNATLLGQFITFAIFVWFTMKFVWPPVMKALEERKKKIADGLAAADRGQRKLELAQHKAADILRDAKIQAADIIDKTNSHASVMIEEAKAQSRIEAQRIIALGKAEIQKDVQKAKLELKNQVASLALDGAEKILGHNIDKAANSDIINKLTTEI